MAIQIRLKDISWDSVRMVNIDGNRHQLEIITEFGAFDFKFSDSEALSEALLILALQSTRRVDYTDDLRFNPRRFGI